MTAIDVTTLTAAQLAELLAIARKAEKEAKATEASLPMFAYLLVMADSKLVYWSGKAVDANAATDAAKAYAVKDGGEVFAMCPRPLPAARGRKAKADMPDTLPENPVDGDGVADSK